MAPTPLKISQEQLTDLSPLPDGRDASARGDFTFSTFVNELHNIYKTDLDHFDKAISDHPTCVKSNEKYSLYE
ncbi:hypothetical protein [Gracilimonas sp.]|uniref:hypothetical protein n=1 Tax=Gracilimonas sp. TaxID=1974203 RepID=UPI002871C344|nr:hypothetical protein [Gracilimonas sp.]